LPSKLFSLNRTSKNQTVIERPLVGEAAIQQLTMDRRRQMSTSSPCTCTHCITAVNHLMMVNTLLQIYVYLKLDR